MQYIHCDELKQLKSFLEKIGATLPELVVDEDGTHYCICIIPLDILESETEEFDSEPYPEIPEEKEVLMELIVLLLV